MARKRYQKGMLFLRGKRTPVWVARWREDETTPQGGDRRILRSVVIGTKADIPTKRLAQRELERRLASINSPDYRPTVALSFSELVTKWEAMVLPSYKASVQRQYRMDVRNHLLPAFGMSRLGSITTETLQKYAAAFKGSPKTLHNVLAVMRAVWRSAKAWGYVKHDPFEAVVLPKQTKPEPKLFTLDEAQQLIREAPEPLKTMLWITAETGVRAGELVALRKEDVDVRGRIVRVRQSLWRGQVQTPKSRAGVRSFSISPGLAEHLTQRVSGEGLLFLNRLGRPFSQSKLVEKHLKPLCTRLGIEPRGLHALRHFNATVLDQLGVPVKVRQSRLGHSTAMVTLDRYTHQITTDDVIAAEKLGAILFPTVPNNTTAPPLASDEAVGVQ